MTYHLGSKTASALRFFEVEEVNVAAFVAGDDQPAIIGQCTAANIASARKRGE
jgi:hypothetical protein